MNKPVTIDVVLESRRGGFEHAIESVFFLLDCLLDDAAHTDDMVFQAVTFELVTLILLHFPPLTAPKLVYLADRIQELSQSANAPLVVAHGRHCRSKLLERFGGLSLITVSHRPPNDVEPTDDCRES